VEGLAGCLLGGLAELLFKLILWLVLLPIFLIVSTPAILIQSLWNLPGYFSEVRFRYGKVVAFWLALTRYG
jgi:hypothetical protein